MDYFFSGPAGYASVEVAGENSRGEEIVAAIGRRPKLNEEIEVELPAALVPEPDNPYDRHAISVRIRGQIVGYLPREDTAKYREAVNRVTASGHVAMTNARIWGAVRETHDGRKNFYSRVTLTLPWDGVKLPVNNPLTEPHAVLPWGGALQVTGEDQHFDVLKNYVAREGDGLALVSLHRLESLLKNGTVREVVEVRIDGQRIGEMTTTTSKHFLPVIAHMHEAGKLTMAWAKVKGSPVSVEVALQAARASEISADWFSGVGANVPALIPPAANYALPPAYVPQVNGNQSAERRGPTAAKPASAKAHAPMEKQAKAGCAGVLVVLAAVGASIGTLATHLA